jgi:hypothetical protein
MEKNVRQYAFYVRRNVSYAAGAEGLLQRDA